jgi:hypothetical protein
MAQREEDLYKPIKRFLCDEINDHFSGSSYVDITSNGVFSKHMKDKFNIISQIQAILPRKLMPDITGYYDNSKLFVVEVKKCNLSIIDIYQAKCYAELIRAESALLISTDDFLSKDRRLLERRDDLLRFSNSKNISIGLFNERDSYIYEWYPRRPW